MFSYHNASRVAHDFLKHIQEVCDKHQIVGSLRRQRDFVNDIDILVIPKIHETTDQTLFAEPVTVSLLDQRIDKLAADGIIKFIVNGPKLKRFDVSARPKPISVDLYVATPVTWATLLLVRTGSRLHNIKLAKRANELHMILKADGTGLLSPGGTLLPMQDEIDIFRELKLQFRLPQERE
jgi:DNA polymerase/3'-5' exonuclease PolX